MIMREFMMHDFHFLDKVGTGQIAIEELSQEQQEYLRFCINKAVSLIPFAKISDYTPED